MRVAILLLAALMMCGCVEEEFAPTPLPTAGTASDGTQKEPPEKPAADETPAEEAKETVFKSEGGISFTMPAGWKKVPVKGNIPEAEYALPKVEGDEFDGRLTMMASGGGLEENLKRWQGEFNGAEAPKVETMMIDGVKASVVDIRGEWKGSSFRPVEPRPEHRLIAVFIPMKGRNDYYVKLTGPKATLAKRDEEITRFLKSASIVSEAK